jgi:hypothetical protein
MRKFLTSLNVFGEYRESVSAYKENMTNFRVVCGPQNCLRIRRKDLCVHEEDANRLKTVYISANISKTVFRFFLFTLYAMDKA